MVGHRRMTDTPPPLYRALNNTCLDALDELVTLDQGQWWRDVLAHPDLIIAVRRQALDVYYRGAALFRISFVRGRPVPRTHVKYLVRQLQQTARLDDAGTFGFDPKAVLWHHYAGPQTLAEMIKAATVLVGPEKTGVHALVKASTNVVDVEIALAGDDEGDPDETDNEPSTPTDGSPSAPSRQDRIDVASLEERGNPKQAWLVFHEAKDFGNRELRAAPKKRPPITIQMGRYRGSIGQNASSLAHSYPAVCRALVQIDALRRTVRAKHPLWTDRPQPLLDSLITEVATGQRRLQVDDDPRLVVFGFDADQRDGAWATIHKRLTKDYGLRVYAVGDPAGSKTAAAFQRHKDIPVVTAAEMAAAKALADTPSPEQIDVPDGGPAEPCLYFGSGRGAWRPIYLCNPGDTALTGIHVQSVGFTLADGELVHTSTATREVAVVPPRRAVLIGRYDVMFDGDFLVPFDVTYTTGASQLIRVRTTIKKGGPSGPWVKLKPVPADESAQTTTGAAATGLATSPDLT